MGYQYVSKSASPVQVSAPTTMTYCIASTQVQAALLLLLVIFGSAKSPGQTSLSPVTGKVLDPTEAAIVGCTITSSEPGDAAPARVTTNEQGRFRILLSSSGGTVSASCDGFDVQEHLVHSTSPKPWNIDFKLRIKTDKESVSILSTSAGVSLEASSTSESQQLNGQTIAELPILNEDYLTFMESFLDPSVTGVQGATVVVNGVEGGNFFQASSAIKSLEVNQDQYSPAYATPGRGRLSLVTTSGTPKLHGTLSFALRNHVFDATPHFSPIQPPENREDYQGVLTGPFFHSKNLKFAISGQMKKDDAFAIVNAILPSGPLTEASPAPYYRDKIGGALYFDDRAGKQWSIGFGRTDEVHHSGAVGGLALPDVADFTEYTGHFLDLQRSQLLSSKTLNQIRLALGQEGLSTQDTTTGPQINVAGAFVGGSRQGTHSYKQYILAGNDLLSRSIGKNTIRVGLDIPELSIHTDNDQTNREGTYYYPSLVAYENATPDLFTISKGNGVVRFASFSAALFFEDTAQINSSTTLIFGARYYFQNVYHNHPDHIAPRFELSHSFGAKSHTVVRVGAGLFYDRLLTTQLSQLLQFNGIRISNYIVNNPADLSGATETTPPSFQQVSPTATIPYVAQWSGALEQQLGANVTFSIQGTMNAGVHQLRMLDVNAPEPTAYTDVPNPAFGQVLASESEGHSHSNSLDFMLRISSLHGMTHQLRYRLAASYNDTDGFSYVPANSYAPEEDRSAASYDQRQNLSLLSTWPLPAKLTLGSVLLATSGLPYTETLGEDLNHDGIVNDRPAGVPRNGLRMDATASLDLRLARTFSLGGRDHVRSLSISGSYFNVANHANYNAYQGVVTSPQFKQPLVAGAPRQFQWNATFNF